MTPAFQLFNCGFGHFHFQFQFTFSVLTENYAFTELHLTALYEKCTGLQKDLCHDWWSPITELIRDRKHNRKSDQMLVYDSLRLSFQLAKLATQLTGLGKEDVKRGGNKGQFSSRAEAASKFSSARVCPPVCVSSPFPDAHTQSFPLLCVSFLSQSSSLMSLLSLSAFTLNPAPSPPSPRPPPCGSCAGDGCVPMVQAGCEVPGGPHDSYWCSGVQLYSHRDPGATHAHMPTHKHAHTQHTYQDMCQTTKKKKKEAYIQM